MHEEVSRRGFLVGAIAGGTSMLGLDKAFAADLALTTVSEPKQNTSPHEHPTSDEDPTFLHPRYAEFSEIPLTAIEPQGWLKAYLETQKNGITGHLDATGGFPFNIYGWAGPGISDVPPNPYVYEQTGYWVDGMIRCGYLLQDKFLIDKATAHTNYVLSHPDKDGYLGPLDLKMKTRWPHVVFFRALFAQASATASSAIPSAVRQHFLSSPYSYSGGRDVCAIEAVLWAYGYEKDKALLQIAEELYQKFDSSYDVNGVSPKMYCDGKPSAAHGVSYNEMAKLGALLYMHTGDTSYLNVSVEAYKKLDTFHMLVDGVHSSSEETREVTPLESHETCDIADYTWSLGYLLMATAKADYADKIERACFNAAPGAVTEDFASLQYFSCPNQVIAAHNTNHNIYFRGDRTMAYATAHIAACCSGNVNRIFPNYASRLWMRDKENGLVAALYGPSQVTCFVGPEHREVKIIETTRYPFSERIAFQMQMKEDTEFTFTVRVPAWCSQAKISINDLPVDQPFKPGTYVRIKRAFHDGDTVLVILPQEVRATTWPFDGIAVERGPLVYSLKIKEEWEQPASVVESVLRAVGVYNLHYRYPGLIGHNVYPKSPWNYALDIDIKNVSRNIQVTENPWHDDQPWSANEPPIALTVPAKRVLGWELDRRTEIELEGGIDDPGITHLGNDAKYDEPRLKRIGDFVFTPQLPVASSRSVELAKEIEMVTLVPYGCAKLRLTIFPWAEKLQKGNSVVHHDQET